MESTRNLRTVNSVKMKVVHWRN